MALSPEDASYVCQQFGIDVDRPLLCQVSRFDPWKDPLGVIDAYRLVKQSVPEVQLALVGSMASDDPEGWDYFNATIAHAGGDPDIHILNNFNNVGAIEVNAFQSWADVVIQKSTREGRSEEHTSELQSRQYLVCRLLLEKKKKTFHTHPPNPNSTSISFQYIALFFLSVTPYT